MQPLLNEFVSEIQKMTGCEAVGVRILEKSGHVPYQAYTGFSEQFYFEAPVLLPDGETLWFQWHSKPRRMDDGTLIRDGVCLDISRRKQAEDALRQSRDDLEVQVQNRTSDLTAINKNLTHEIENRKQAEDRLRKAYSEIAPLKNQLEAECAYLGEEIKQIHDHGNIIGESEVMKYVLCSMEQIAPTDTTVLVLGESGTGKELIARAIHHNSRRKDRPLITRNTNDWEVRK